MNTQFVKILFSAACAFSFSSSYAQEAPILLTSNKGITLTTADLLADISKTPVAAQKQMLSSNATVTRLLENIHNRKQLARDAVAQGIDKEPTVAQALESAREKILMDAFIAKLDASNVPSDSVSESYARSTYKAQPERFKRGEERRASHILISKDKENSQKTAEAVLDQLRAGADFSALVAKYSDDKASAAQNGDLGFFAPDRMVKPFADAAFALTNINDLSNVVTTQFGYHIIKLTDKKPAGLRPFDEVKDGLKNEITVKTQMAARAAVEKNLRESITVEEDAIVKFSDTYK
jgi:peptidyl-prolyl cis-trans isomerase C